jgi:hypothetical protein
MRPDLRNRPREQECHARGDSTSNLEIAQKTNSEGKAYPEYDHGRSGLLPNHLPSLPRRLNLQ